MDIEKIKQTKESFDSLESLIDCLAAELRKAKSDRNQALEEYKKALRTAKPASKTIPIWDSIKKQVVEARISNVFEYLGKSLEGEDIFSFELKDYDGAAVPLCERQMAFAKAAKDLELSPHDTEHLHRIKGKMVYLFTWNGVEMKFYPRLLSCYWEGQPFDSHYTFGGYTAKIRGFYKGYYTNRNLRAVFDFLFEELSAEKYL